MRVNDLTITKLSTRLTDKWMQKCYFLEVAFIEFIAISVCLQFCCNVPICPSIFIKKNNKPNLRFIPYQIHSILDSFLIRYSYVRFSLLKQPYLGCYQSSVGVINFTSQVLCDNKYSNTNTNINMFQHCISKAETLSSAGIPKYRK